MIQIDSKKEYDLNNSMVAAQNIQLGTYLKELDLSRTYQYSGVRVKPSLVDNGDGSVTIGTGTYGLFPDSSGSSAIEVFDVAGGTFTLTDEQTNYFYVYYNGGSPVLLVSIDKEDVIDTNLTNKISVYNVYRYRTIINALDWDECGLGMAEKLALRCIETDAFHRLDGLWLSEYGTRNVAISEGHVYYGPTKMHIPEFASASIPDCNLYLLAKEGTTFNGSPITQADNTHYQGPNGTGLQTLAGGKYNVNWIYRFISGSHLCYSGIVLGDEEYSHTDVLKAQPPTDLPVICQTQGMLVGRIIYKASASSADHVDSAFEVMFTPTDLSHNGLTDLQGGVTNEYYHLTETNYNKISGSTYQAQFGTAPDFTAFENDGTMIMSGSATVWDDLFFPLMTGKQGQTDQPAFDFNSMGYLFPQANSTQIMYITAQFPHSWKIGSTIYPHIHWKQENTGSPVFKLDYKWFPIGGSVPNTFQTYVMDTKVMPYTSGSMHQLNSGSAGISGSDITGVSSMMLMKLYRDDNAYTGNALTYQLDIHIERDALGSKSLYTK